LHFTPDLPLPSDRNAAGHARIAGHASLIGGRSADGNVLDPSGAPRDATNERLDPCRGCDGDHACVASTDIATRVRSAALTHDARDARPSAQTTAWKLRLRDTGRTATQAH